MVDPWKTLGIAETDDERTIKKAYAARVKRMNPEDDSEGFQQLRQAYERALQYARWHKAQLQPAIEPRKRPAPPLAPSAPRSPAPHDTSITVRKFELEWAKEAADQLLARVVELRNDPNALGSEQAWQELLAHECLWNVETRQRFERSLIELIVGRQFEASAAVLCLLEQEFHFTDQAFLLYRFLPRDDVDRFLKRLEQAPIERAQQLFDEGRYDELEAFLKRATSGRRADQLAQVARTLLERCAGARATERLMSQVRQLRADETTWRSVPAWKALLAHDGLRDAETRSVFQKSLFGYLATNGEGLTGAVWRLLDAALRWTSTYTARELAQATALRPALLEHIESLLAEAKHQEIIRRWRGVIAQLDGEAAEKGRLLLERSCLGMIEHAERLQAEARYREALEEVAQLTALQSGDIAKRAYEFLHRCRVALVADAERFVEQHRHAAAVTRLGPVVADIEGELGTRARLLLARSHLALGAPGKADDCLKELLRSDPANVTALELLAAAYRARGLLGHASSTYQRVLTLDPGNQHAARELRSVEKQQANEPAYRPSKAEATNLRTTTQQTPDQHTSDNHLNPVWLLLILAVVNNLRGPWATDTSSQVLLNLLMVLLVFGAIGALLLMLDRSESPLSLGLHVPEPENQPTLDAAERRRAWSLRAALAVLSVAVVIATAWWLRGP